MEPLRIFIGYDSRFPEPAHVLAYTIKKNIGFPTQIKYLILSDLQKDGLIWRKDLDKGSTEFTYTRFLVPYLCNYEGYALFLDNDMICLGDCIDLWPPHIYYHHKFTLQLVKHKQEIISDTKMYGCPQIPYERKNWSSLMLINCNKLQQWTLRYVNEVSGLDLHQFKYVKDEEIWGLPNYYNQLDKLDEITYDEGFLHYTSGGPWFNETKECQHADLWLKEYKEWKEIIPLDLKRDL